MLIATFISTADFLRAYGRGTDSLSRRLVLNGFGVRATWRTVAGRNRSERGGARQRRAAGLGTAAVAPAPTRLCPGLPAASARDSAHGPLELPVYMGAEAVARALERVDGDPGPRGGRLRAALSKVAFDGPAGPVRLDRNRQAIVSVHLRRIEGRGEEARTVPFRVERDVDQSFAGAFDTKHAAAVLRVARVPARSRAGLGRGLSAGLHPRHRPGEAGVAVAWRETSRAARHGERAGPERSRRWPAPCACAPALRAASARSGRSPRGRRPPRRTPVPPARGPPARAPPARRARAVPPARRWPAGGWRLDPRGSCWRPPGAAARRCCGRARRRSPRRSSRGPPRRRARARGRGARRCRPARPRRTERVRAT